MAQNLFFAEKYLPGFDPISPISVIGNRALLYGKDGNLEVYYAPFDHIAAAAKLVVVGITPGLRQAVAAFEAIRSPLRLGHKLPDALRHAKLAASFSGGAMRNNLIAMLDAIGVAELFSMPSTSALFTKDAEFVHFTSALRYPVFAGGANYNGNPDMLRTPFLRQMVETHLAEEAAALPGAIWLPLGPKAEAAVVHLSNAGLLDRKRILAGLPHPSGANAERVAVFLGRKNPALASRQTNPTSLLQSFRFLGNQISELKRSAA